MAIPSNKLAEIGLNIESDREIIIKKYPAPEVSGSSVNVELPEDTIPDLGEVTQNENLKGYRIRELQYIRDIEGNLRLKSIAYQDEEGNIYVHFTGTGDGNWDYNKAAYDDEPSPIQVHSAEFTEHIIEEYGEQGKDVYITGHSQGGNTAQYVTMMIDSKLSERITMTVSADGPGFSEAIYNKMHERSDFEAQRQKIYAYNGDADYVNPLGQVQLILDNQRYMVRTGETGYRGKEKDGLLHYAHAANYMLNPDGSLNKFLPYDEALEQGWRQPLQWAIIVVNQWVINNVPKEDQTMIARLVMAIVETVMPGSVKGDFSVVADIIKAHVPGAEAVIDRIILMCEEKGFTSMKEIWDYITQDPLNNLMELLSYVFADKDGLIGLMKMAGFFAILIKLIPLLWTLLKMLVPIILKVLAVVAAVLVALVILKLVADFLVKVWDAITDAIEAAIDYITKLAQELYAYVRGRVEAAIDVAVETAKYVFDSMKGFAEKAYTDLANFANYVKQSIKDTYATIQNVANKTVQTVAGFIQKGVTLQMALLQSCVDRMNALATRVQMIDERLDQLYYRLCASEIEQGEGIIVTLIAMYNLAWADFNVDEGNRIRRMANNLTQINEKYKEVEKWAMALQLGG